MELLLPDKPIAALEENVIYRYSKYEPVLGVVIKKEAKPDEKAYLRSIQKDAEKYKASVKVIYANTSVEASIVISELRQSANVSGIIVLSSYGKEVDYAINNMIPTRLDLDCVSSGALGALMTTTSPVGYRIAPCAPVAVMKVLEYHKIDLTNKNVAVLGRSLRVGRPLAEILCQHNANVTVYHSKSAFDLWDFDIVVSAIGKAKKIDSSYFDVNKAYTLIDVGMNTDKQGRLCGDFDFESFKDMDVRITPVPGCIGPLATTVLFTKLFVNAASMRGEIIEQGFGAGSGDENKWLGCLR